MFQVRRSLASRLLRHVVGHTIMDNVFALNGTFFVVILTAVRFPALATIASSAEDSSATPRPSDWQVLSSAQEREKLFKFGGLRVPHTITRIYCVTHRPHTGSAASAGSSQKHHRVCSSLSQHAPHVTHPVCPGNYTLLSLSGWRTYSTLDTSLSPDRPVPELATSSTTTAVISFATKNRCCHVTPLLARCQ